jgi:hypothetical protein
MAALRARSVGPLHQGLLRPRWIGSLFLDQVFEIAPPAGFEPARTAPETMCGVAVTPALTCGNVPTALAWADVLS